MSEGPTRTRVLLSCLGAASLSALTVALVEVLLAAWTPNALLSAVPTAERVRYLALVLAAFPVVVLPATLVGFAAASIRPQLGIPFSLALPPLLLAVESFRHAGQFQGFTLVLGWTAVVLALVLVVLFRHGSVTVPTRATLTALAAAFVLSLGLWPMPRGMGDASLAGALGPSVPLPENAGPQAKNLLVLLVDTLRADHLGCYGYARETSPRIDAFAREGTLFENAATPKPKTSPAVASLFTGTWPQTHRVHAARTELLEENVTLAETLKQGGFTTFGISANTNINKTLGYGQGFDELRWMVRVELKNGTTIDNHAGQLASQVILWLQQHRDERFFAYVHLIDPHSPYRPPPAYAEMFQGDELDGRLGSSDQEAPSKHYIDRIENSVYLPEAGFNLDEYVARYDGEIRFTDDAIGEILDALDRLGLSDSTAVVFLSDHGESVIEHHAYFNHGLFPYEEQVHVPLVLRGPGIAAGQRRTEQVSLVGLMPTLLDLVGVSPPQQVEADSFAGLLRADVPAQEGPPTLLSAREQIATMTWGLRTNRWKYLFNPGKRSLAKATRFLNLAWPGKRLAYTVADIRNYQLEEELYDLHADPLEVENLAYRQPALSEQLRDRMQALRSASEPVNGAPRLFSSREFSEEAQKDLMRLGYLGK